MMATKSGNNNAFFFNLLMGRVHIAPLASFRILLGIMLFFSTARFMAKGWIDDLYVKPLYYFSYYGFEWIQPVSREGMYAIYVVMLIAALLITLGLFYRVAAFIFFLAFTYVELLDKTNYLNHYYFVSIVSLLMVLVPANKFASLDVKFGFTERATHVPAWCIHIFKLQIGIVYFFAGVAKINPDWLLHAQPLKIWLSGRDYLPVIGPVLALPVMPYIFSWVGMLFDISIFFFLINSKTRPFAYTAVVIFHMLTGYLFQIGVFPYVMMVATWIFFSEQFHLRILSVFDKSQAVIKNYTMLPAVQHLILSLLTIHFVFQLLLPMRYVLYPGKLFWTEQGYRFSWRVMLMEKNGYTSFVVKDNTGKVVEVKKSNYLTPQQDKMMSTQPDMILQFAHYVADEYARMGWKNPAVYVDAYVSLNGRRSSQFIDPNVDLAKENESFLPKKWILAPQ